METQTLDTSLESTSFAPTSASEIAFAARHETLKALEAVTGGYDDTYTCICRFTGFLTFSGGRGNFRPRDASRLPTFFARQFQKAYDISWMTGNFEVKSVEDDGANLLVELTRYISDDIDRASQMSLTTDLAESLTICLKADIEAAFKENGFTGTWALGELQLCKS